MLGQLAQRTFWQSKQEAASVGTIISTLAGLPGRSGNLENLE